MKLPKVCPHCGITAHSEVSLQHLFGVRLGGKHPQPWCRGCRSRHRAKSRTCDCRKETLFRHAERLVGVKLEPVVRALKYKPSNKGRYGRAVETLLGLRGDDNQRLSDWNGEIEVKWVSLTRGRAGCWRVKDKVFITSDNETVDGLPVDPIEKIRKVLWVFGDYSSKRVLSCCYAELSKTDIALLRMSAHLEKARGPRRLEWRYLFRNTKGNAPGKYAYYLHPRFFVDQAALAAHIAAVV